MRSGANSDALLAQECQSFLDNDITDFPASGSLMDQLPVG
jgi:hypothetical protein